MSSSARRGTVRAGDLTLPAAPSQPSSSRPTSRTTPRGSSRAAQAEQSSATHKRKRDPDVVDDDDLFGDSFASQEVVDLVDKDEVPPEILSTQEKNKNFVRLSAFDCVICMDNIKDLTVTHCGHLFCAECLQSALSVGQARRICPICRQKIDKLPNSGKFGRQGKGFYPLELKLTTRRALGTKTERSSQGAAP